jgi:hypothetical protein
MRARGWLAVAILAVLALGGLAGCSKKLRPIQNLPPDTYLFVQGPVDVVNHRVHLYWYGTDPDGIVAAYAVRWVYPAPAPQDVPWDTIWVADDATPRDSMFTMFTGDSAEVMPRFEVFAIDNQLLADPTPAVETFLLSNIAPTVRITNPLDLADSTYASVTISWETTDPDGGGPGLHYRVWLDGNQAAYDSTSDATFTVPSARFLQGDTYRTGPRTLYLQAVDDGGRSGPVTSMTWFVRAPAAVLEGNRGRLLLIDDVPSSGANNLLFDGFYKSIADLLPAGTYSTLRPQFNPDIFRSGGDVAQTFRQFQAVLWYRGGEITVSSWLRFYQDSIGGWLDGGGKLYLDGLYLIEGLNTPGAFRESFVTQHLGSSGLVNCFANIGGGVTDSTAGWGARSGSQFRSSRYGESFRLIAAPPVISGGTGGMRVFAVNDTSLVALWAMIGQMEPPNTDFEAPVAVTVPQGANGRIVLSSLPLRYGSPTQVSNILRRILNEFGIGIPLP